MKNLVWRNIGRFLLLMATQFVVLNRVDFGGYLLPMIYVLFVLMLPTNMKRIPMLLVAFATGLVTDMLNNMLGIHALACTVVAMLRICFADRILTRGEPVAIESPGINSVTPQYFVAYLVIMLAAFYLVLFSVEMFSFKGFWSVLLATLLSTVVTALIAVLYQAVFTKKDKQK